MQEDGVELMVGRLQCITLSSYVGLGLEKLCECV